MEGCSEERLGGALSVYSKRPGGEEGIFGEGRGGW